MRRNALALGLCLAMAPAAHAHPHRHTPTTATSAADKAPKVKAYNFGALDLEGRLRTPQLLYFLNRMKSELDSTVPDKRSFMPELYRSVDQL